MERVLDRLIAKRSSTLKGIEEITNLKFIKDDAFSNAYYTNFKWKGNSSALPVSEAELRIPAENSDSKECIIIFKMKKNNPFTEDYLLKKFSRKITLETPNAHQEHDQITYYKLIDNYYSLSFGFEKDERECHEVIIKYRIKESNLVK